MVAVAVYAGHGGAENIFSGRYAVFHGVDIPNLAKHFFTHGEFLSDCANHIFHRGLMR